MIRIFLFLVTLVSGAAAVWVFMSRMEGQIAAPPPSSELQQVAVQVVEPETTDVLIAAQPVARGSLIEAGQLEWMAWPNDALQDTFIRRDAEPDAIARTITLAAAQDIASGDPIRWSRLEPPRPENLSASLPPGKRAIAVAVSVESTAGGFVLPNDRVDVIHTYTDDQGTNSRTVATNVRVIAMDQSLSQEDNVLIGRTATLELDAEQVEAVTAAELSGRLSLALRSAADSEENPGVYEPAKMPRSVRIISNGRIQTIPFSQ